MPTPTPIQQKLATICATIKNVRLQHKMTQSQLAYALNTDRNTYRKIECGQIPLRIDKLIRISEVLNINMKELVS